MFDVFYTFLRLPIIAVSNGLGVVQTVLQGLDDMLPPTPTGEKQPVPPDSVPTREPEENQPITAQPLAGGDAAPPTFRCTLCKGSRTVFFQNQSPGPGPYSWSFGDGATSQQVSPKHTYEADGNYSVGLSVASHVFEMDIQVSKKSPIGSGPPVVVGNKLAVLPEKTLDSINNLGPIEARNNPYSALYEATKQLCRLANDAEAAMPYRMGDHDPTLVRETNIMLTSILEEMVHNEPERQKLWSCYHIQLANFLFFMRFRVWDIEADTPVFKQLETIIEQIEAAQDSYQLQPVAWAHVHFRASPLHDDKPLLKEKFQRIRNLLK